MLPYASYEDIVSKLTSDKPTDQLIRIIEENKKTTNENDGRPSLAQVEFNALVDRIINIISVTVQKIEVAASMPSLLFKDKELLLKYMPATQRIRLSNYCEKYLQEIQTTSERSGRLAIIDQHLAKAVDILYKNKKIKDEIPSYLNNLPQYLQSFLGIVKDMKNIVEIKLKTTAAKELAREKLLHRVHCENEKEKVKIQDALSTIKEREAIQYWQIARRNNNINIYKKELNDKKWKSNILIQKEIAKANARMMTIYSESEERKAELKEKVSIAKNEYDTCLAKSMALDKQLRDKKTRVLNQLHTWIKKYDNDVEEKTLEIQKLSDELTEKTKILDDFMTEFGRQEKEYFNVITLKEAEEKQTQQERMLIFMMNRAAKIIQITWRRYLQKKKKKGKGKGRGKKAKK